VVAAPRKKKPAGKPGRRERATEPVRSYRIPWAELLAKVFEIDVLACPECGGRMQLIAFIAEPAVAKRILDHLARARRDGTAFGAATGRPARLGRPSARL